MKNTRESFQCIGELRSILALAWKFQERRTIVDRCLPVRLEHITVPFTYETFLWAHALHSYFASTFYIPWFKFLQVRRYGLVLLSIRIFLKFRKSFAIVANLEKIIEIIMKSFNVRYVLPRAIRILYRYLTPCLVKWFSVPSHNPVVLGSILQFLGRTRSMVRIFRT